MVSPSLKENIIQAPLQPVVYLDSTTGNQCGWS